DEALHQRLLAFLEVIDHAAAAPELEVIELLGEPIGEPASSQRQLHRETGFARMQPLESRVAPGSAPAPTLPFQQHRLQSSLCQEIGRRRGDEDIADEHHLLARGHLLSPRELSTHSFRWKELRVSMQRRFQLKYDST